MDLKRIAIALALLICGSANASTILGHTDGNMNFRNSSIDFSQPGTQLAMFSVGDLGDTANAGVILNERRAFAVAEFTPLTGTWSVDIKRRAGSSTSLDSLTLFGGDHCVLGISHDGGATWSADSGVTEAGTDQVYVNFTDGQVLVSGVQVVPLPATVWLFGTGMMGMIAVARRHAV